MPNKIKFPTLRDVIEAKGIKYVGLIFDGLKVEDDQGERTSVYQRTRGEPLQFLRAKLKSRYEKAIGDSDISPLVFDNAHLNKLASEDKRKDAFNEKLKSLGYTSNAGKEIKEELIDGKKLLGEIIGISKNPLGVVVFCEMPLTMAFSLMQIYGKNHLLNLTKTYAEIDLDEMSNSEIDTALRHAAKIGFSEPTRQLIRMKKSGKTQY